MMKESDTARVDRRKFLQTTAAAFSGAAFLPLLECRNEAGATALAANPSTSGGDPDQLFRSGRFAQADWGYQRILAGDPANVHALARRGYIALLSNQFAKAENFLRRAIRLAPDDNALKEWLADCYVRQDDFARAVPLLRDSGNQANADQYASITGKPYEVCGAMATRLPFQVIDPLPVVEAAVNGKAGTFFLDTGATLGIKPEMVEAAGIREVAKVTTVGRGNGELITLYFGVMDSFQLGGIELRNIPVLWNDLPLPTVPGAEKQPIGAIGTTILYHFLSTMDYANRALILRRKTNVQLRAFQAEAIFAGAAIAPLWMAPDHYLFSQGSINGFGPGLVSLDTGGPGFGVGMTDEFAARAGIVPDYTMPRQFFGITVYPCVANEVSLGTAVRRDIPGIVGPLPLRVDRFGFESIANITHEFFRPLAVTFDFVNMSIYIR
jgi:tetratricopeptide (TPR) repeat protein